MPNVRFFFFFQYIPSHGVTPTKHIDYDGHYPETNHRLWWVLSKINKPDMWWLSFALVRWQQYRTFGRRAPTSCFYHRYVKSLSPSGETRKSGVVWLFLFDLFLYFLHLISYRILLGSLFHENWLRDEREQGIRSGTWSPLFKLARDSKSQSLSCFKALRVLLDWVRVHADH